MPQRMRSSQHEYSIGFNAVGPQVEWFVYLDGKRSQGPFGSEPEAVARMKEMVAEDDAGPNRNSKSLRKGRPTGEFDDESRTITWVMTTGVEDRDGETVDPEGGDFGEFMKNPTVQFNHDTDDFPIGRLQGEPWNDYVGEGTKYDIGGERRMALLGKVYFSKENPKGDLAYRMAKEGTLGGGSISFLPMDPPRKNGNGGNHYGSWKLLEFTVCPIGSNPDAVKLSLRKAELKGYFGAVRSGVSYQVTIEVTSQGRKKVWIVRLLADGVEQGKEELEYERNAYDLARRLRQEYPNLSSKKSPLTLILPGDEVEVIPGSGGHTQDRAGERGIVQEVRPTGYTVRFAGDSRPHAFEKDEVRLTRKKSEKGINDFSIQEQDGSWWILYRGRLITREHYASESAAQSAIRSLVITGWRPMESDFKSKKMEGQTYEVWVIRGSNSTRVYQGDTKPSEQSARTMAEKLGDYDDVQIVTRPVKLSYSVEGSGSEWFAAEGESRFGPFFSRGIAQAWADRLNMGKTMKKRKLWVREKSAVLLKDEGPIDPEMQTYLEDRGLEDIRLEDEGMEEKYEEILPEDFEPKPPEEKYEEILPEDFEPKPPEEKKWVIDIEGHGPMTFETEQEAQSALEELREMYPDLAIELNEKAMLKRKQKEIQSGPGGTRFSVFQNNDGSYRWREEGGRSRGDSGFESESIAENNAWRTLGKSKNAGVKFTPRQMAGMWYCVSLETDEQTGPYDSREEAQRACDEANAKLTPEQKQPSADIDPEKACKILEDGTVNGEPLTEEQRGMFGAACARARKSFKLCGKCKGHKKSICAGCVSALRKSMQDGGGPAGFRALKAWIKQIETDVADLEQPQVVDAAAKAIKLLNAAMGKAYGDLTSPEDDDPDEVIKSHEVYQEGGKWFCRLDDGEEYGPYNTEAEARQTGEMYDKRLKRKTPRVVQEGSKWHIRDDDVSPTEYIGVGGTDEWASKEEAEAALRQYGGKSKTAPGVTVQERGSKETERPGWYVMHEGIAVSGPFVTESEARSAADKYQPLKAKRLSKKDRALLKELDEYLAEPMKCSAAGNKYFAKVLKEMYDEPEEKEITDEDLTEEDEVRVEEAITQLKNVEARLNEALYRASGKRVWG